MVKDAAVFLDSLQEELRAKGFDAALKAAESDPTLREKICLVGEKALYEAKRNPAFMKTLYVLLDRDLTHNEDRALFDLPPLPPAAPETGQP